MQHAQCHVPLNTSCLQACIAPPAGRAPAPSACPCRCPAARTRSAAGWPPGLTPPPPTPATRTQRSRYLCVVSTPSRDQMHWLIHVREVVCRLYARRETGSCAARDVLCAVPHSVALAYQRVPKATASLNCCCPVAWIKVRHTAWDVHDGLGVMREQSSANT